MGHVSSASGILLLLMRTSQVLKTRGRRVYYHAEGNPHWKGGTYRHHGRVQVLCPDHPNSGQNNYVLRARLVMEKQLVRFLNQDEVVHHINHVTDDDRIQNLQLMTILEHNTYHAQHQTNGRWARNFDCCAQCGTKEVPHAGRGLCNRCNDKRRWPEKWARLKARQNAI